MRDFLTYFYWGTLTVVSFYLMFRFRKVDRATKFICLLVWLGLLTEAFGYYAARVYRNNYQVYNFSFYLEFLLTTLYFNYSVDVLRKKGIGIYIAVIGIVAGIINTVFFQSLYDVLDSNFIFLECITVISLSILAFCYLLLIDDDRIRFQWMPHFWFPCILVFYQCATLSAWGVYDKYGNDIPENAVALDISLLAINTITYLSYGLVFLYYPKMKAPNV